MVAFGGAVVDLRIDMQDVEAAARELGGFIDQVPYASARALNDAALATRKSIIDELWPSKVHVRNTSFLGWALRTKFANKANLTVEVNDERANGRGHLGLHAEGGTKHAAGRFAIPVDGSKRGASGMPSRLKPRNLKNTFVRNGVLYQRVGKHRLKAVYFLKSDTKQPADVPFYQHWESRFMIEFENAFPKRLDQAGQTRYAER